MIRNILITLLLLLPCLMLGQTLPHIDLHYEALSTDTFSMGRLTYHDGESEIVTDCLVRQRGGESSVARKKKAFAIKCIDAQGEKQDIRFGSLRKDNYWILNAAACDPSRIRDLVSWQLWLDCSRQPYHQEQEPKAINGSRGMLVEVDVNGEYYGVFTLMERIDRKQLKLKKHGDSPTDDVEGDTIMGVLYKAKLNTSRSTYFYYQSQSPVDSRPTWDGFEASYPDLTDGEPFSWQPLRKGIYYIAASTASTYDRTLTERIDLPVFIDWELFRQLLAAEDNYGKNFYLWYYDITQENKMGVTPWDMDWSWGNDSNNQRIPADKEMKEMDNLQKRLHTYYAPYRQLLSNRWAELRGRWLISDSLCQRFDAALDLLEESGAAQREAERWDGVNGQRLDFAAERQYLHQWIADRLNFLDQQYGYDGEAIVTPVTDAPFGDDVTYDLMGRRVTDSKQGIRIGRKGISFRP